MRLASLALLSLVGASLGFNIDASAIRAAEAAQIGEDAPRFGNITIPGQIQPTSLVFPDGLHLLLYSPRAQNLSVEKKDQPSAPAGFVTPLDFTAVSLGSGSWMPIYNYSWIINFEAQNVDDVIATMEVPYSRDLLETLDIRHENTFLARFDSARRGWVVDTSKASVESARNTTRMVGSSTLGGEYMLLGRKSTGAHNTFLRLGSSDDSSDFRVEDPPADSLGQTDPSKAPVQLGTWENGFQLEVRSCKGMRINMNLFNVSEGKVQQGYTAISSYGYMLNSSEPSSKVAVIARLPLRRSQIEAHSLNDSRLQVAQLDPTSGEFRVHPNFRSNATPSSPQILRGFIEIEASSLDVKWILVAPEVVDSTMSSPGPTTSASTTADGRNTVTTVTSLSSLAPGPNTPVTSATAPASAVISVVTPLNGEGTEKVMKLERAAKKSPSRSRMRRIRYSKSELL